MITLGVENEIPPDEERKLHLYFWGMIVIGLVAAGFVALHLAQGSMA